MYSRLCDKYEWSSVEVAKDTFEDTYFDRYTPEIHELYKSLVNARNNNDENTYVRIYDELNMQDMKAPLFNELVYTGVFY